MGPPTALALTVDWTARLDTDRNIPQPPIGHKTTAKAGREYHQTLPDVRDEFHRLINHYVLSFNTVSFNTSQPITSEDRRVLSEFSRYVTRPWQSRFPILRKYGTRLTDPSPPAMAYVADRFPDHRLNRVDATIDFITDDPPALVALLWRTVCQKWRGHQREMTIWQGTMHYWAVDQKGRNIGLYIKPRPELGLVVRLEIRISGAGRCRIRGMSQMSDLLRFDIDALAALLDHETWLVVIDLDMARRLIAKQAREDEQTIGRHSRKFALDRAGLRRRYERHLCAFFHTEEGDIPDWEELGSFPAQGIVDWMPFLDGALRRAPPSDILIRGCLPVFAASC
jgi:hypothetical protein